VRGWEAGCFGAGWLVLALALLSPLHHLSERLLWAHMVQHELLMVLAAPLLVLGRPLETWNWGLPRAWRAWASMPRRAMGPVSAWTLHAAALWVWHVPAFFDAALASPALHALQHTSFFVTALLFWWAVLAPGASQVGAVISLFTTMLHTGALGALMALAPTPWYGPYALQDQQLAGLVMWVPAGLAYPGVALYLMSKVLRACAPSSS
jgi:putative membrane protein